MKPTDRIHVLAQAQATVEWLLTEPHTLERAVEVLRDTSPRPSADPRPRPIVSGQHQLGHADPTGAGTGRIAGTLARASDAVAGLDSRLSAVGTAAVTLDEEASTAVGRVLPSPAVGFGRQLVLGVVAVRLERLQLEPSINVAWSRVDPARVPELDRSLGVLGADVAWLGTEVARHLRDAVIDRPEPVQQRRLDTCQVHARFAREGAMVPMALPGRTLCEQCQRFKDNHSCVPTEAIIRRWDYGSPATPAQLLEAKAAGRARFSRRAG